MNDEVLTTREAAKLLKMDSQSVQRMAARGDLPGKMMGNRWRFSREVILSQLAENKGEVKLVKRQVERR